MHDLSGLLSTTSPKKQILTDYVPIPASPSPTPFICNQYKFFQNNLPLSSPNLIYRGAHQLQDGGHVCLPMLPRHWWLRLHAQGPRPLSGSNMVR